MTIKYIKEYPKSQDEMTAWRKKGYVAPTKVGGQWYDPKAQTTVEPKRELPDVIEEKPEEPIKPRTSRYGEEAEGYLSQFQPVTAGDEAGIREQKRKDVQGYLDSINQMYTSLVSGEQQRGEEMLGQTRAMGARGGILTSDIGAAQMEKTKGFTKENVQLLQEERQVKINAILDKVDQRATEEIRLKKAEALAGQEAYIGYLKEVQESSREEIKELASAGVSLERLKSNEEYYNQFLEETGWSKLQFDAVYNNSLSEEQKVDWNYQTVTTPTGMKVLAYGIDPQTGKLSQESYDVDFEMPEEPKDWKFMIAPNGTALFYTDQGELEVVGDEGRFAKGEGVGDTDAQYKEGLIADKKDGMTLEEAINDYGSVLSPSYIKNMYEYGEKAEEKAEEKKEFLSTDYFRELWTEKEIGQAAGKAGWTGLLHKRSTEITNYLNDLMRQVKAFRKQGKTDKEIFELINPWE